MKLRGGPWLILSVFKMGVLRIFASISLNLFQMPSFLLTAKNIDVIECHFYPRVLGVWLVFPVLNWKLCVIDHEGQDLEAHPQEMLSPPLTPVIF